MLNESNLHSYQRRAVDFILDNHSCALFLDMGLGKSITSLTAIEKLLYDSFTVSKVLVIAPLRVANSVFHKEATNWEHTKNLKFSICTGSLQDRKNALEVKADVYVINRENVTWLVDYYKNKFPFDMVVIDESSSFKSPTAKRFKSLKKILHKINRVVLLTGTPSPNGYMDLWSQIYLLDGGVRLGTNITQFRSRYFDKDFMGFNYTLRAGAVKNIQDKISDLVLSMQSEDYLELPDKINIIMENKLDGTLLKKYKTLEKDMILAVNSEDKITAMSAGVLTNKLLQFCSGNMYDENGSVHHFHNLKIDSLKEIMEENPDENLLVAYNYKHELEALTKEFPNAVILDKKGEAIDKWNNGEIKILLAHPASASMGLNLQHGGSMLVWYGFTWSLELYQQFNARLYRQGQKDTVRIIHISVGEVEAKLMQTLAQKDVSQDELLKALK